MPAKLQSNNDNGSDGTVVQNTNEGGTSDTQLNAFLADVDDAFAEVHSAIGKAEGVYKALLTKLGV